MSSKSKKTREVLSDHKTDPTTSIPWSEWSDSELNSERWDTPRNGIDGNFEDPEPRVMPPSIEPHDWKRGFGLKNLSNNLVLFTPSNEYPDFTKNNKHILHSQFVRWFISTMINLQYVGRNGLKLEGEPSNSTWLGESRPWKGWMYIYSMNKVGTGVSEHRPIVNPNGKYIVRLFFMGSWRRFIIDDMIPVDDNGTPLLPRTENDFELWPMLLAKAVMKLASLSWTGQREINDFYPISCFTGWICLPLLSRNISQNEKWQLFTKYTNEGAKDDENRQPTIFIFAKLAEELSDETIPGVTPCFEHVIHVEKLRDLTVESSQARWKAYRYFDWATKRGIMRTENSPYPAARSLKLISALRRCNTQNKEAEIREIEVWTDFVKLAPYLEEIFLFYKMSDFEYHARISGLLRTSTTAVESHVHVTASASSRVKSQATGGRESKKTQAPSTTVFLSSLKWEQDNISSCMNDPLFMLIDSIETKFVLIDFCSMQRQRVSEFKGSYLSVEKYNLFERSSSDNEPVALIKTSSIGATIFEAGPGRHLYRLYFRPGHCYFVRILSDTIFHLGDRFRIHDLMSLESDRIDTMARNISDKISSAFLEFGKPNYAVQLRLFYDSYLPNENKHLQFKNDKMNVHQQFIEELVKLINETCSVTESAAICRSLRVFFINPSIGVETKSEKAFENSIFDISATKIQSLFRMLLIKAYKNLHSPTNPKHSEIVNSLQKVVELFNLNSKSRESIAKVLIRRIVERSMSLYPCRDDLNQVFDVEEFKGILRNVQPNQWIPLLRIVVNAPSPGCSVNAAIDVATSLPRYVVRVVNNESYHEVMRFVNKVPTVNYPHVDRGYTIFAYGWSDGSKFKELDWRLRITTIKGQSAFVTKLQNLTVQEFSNNYVPTVTNIFGKWIVNIFGDSLLSFRLSTSYDLAEIALKIIDNDDNVLYEGTGGSVIILPAVFLPFTEERKSVETEDPLAKSRSRSQTLSPNADDTATRYYVQAYVANDSWPLTPTEWSVVNETKARGTVYDPRYGRNSVTSVSSKRGIKSKPLTRGFEDRLHGAEGEITSDNTSQTIFQHPFYRLQIVTDVGSKIKIENDRRRETDIAEMKKLWEESEPGRLIRGKEIREEYFKENCMKNNDTALSLTASAENMRTLKPGPNSSRLLPPWDISAYVIEDEEDQRWVKTEGDEEMLRNQRAINILDFDQAQITSKEEYESLINEQRQRYSDLFNSYTKKINHWNNSFEKACEKRDNYITELKTKLATNVVKKTKDKETKNKNQNKNKK